MTMKPDGGPTFPVETNQWACFGMSLRDYFAAAALEGILPALHAGIRPVDIEKMTYDCYAVADAMLKAREA